MSSPCVVSKNMISSPIPSSPQHISSSRPMCSTPAAPKKSQRSAKTVRLDDFFDHSSYSDKQTNSRSSRNSTDSDNVRTKAFEVLGDKDKMAERLTRTKMCSSVENNTNCRHGAKCRFAHNLDELRVADCVFTTNCKLVAVDSNNIWSNRSGIKMCKCKHPEETLENFYDRTGLSRFCKDVKKDVKKDSPAPVVNKWNGRSDTIKNNVGFSILTDDDDEEPGMLTPDKLTPVKLFEPKSEPEHQECEEETVIRVPAEMAEAAMEAAMKAGKFNIRIVIVD